MNTPPDLLSGSVAEHTLLSDVLTGLSNDFGEKSLPSRYLYDQRGCELFEAICATPEYYLTRTELAIMRRDSHTMAKVCGSNCQLVELGSGASIKTELLLDKLTTPAMYVPVDIAPEYLVPSAKKLNQQYPDLVIEPICANFVDPFEIPIADNADRTVVYFPGSTIGNFPQTGAVELLIQMREMTGPQGGILVGMDLKKDISLLESAYNDVGGVTAKFTGNLLTRLQRDLEADLEPADFQHFARYNVEEGRIEIYLRSTADQIIRIGDDSFEIANGELINTEYSYKYSLEDVRQMALDAGVALTHAWLDEQNWFGVFFFSCAS